MGPRAKPAGRPRKDGAARTTWVVRPPDLLPRFRRQAMREGLDVSDLLCHLAETYLQRKGARR
jgi:hypothetical protein